MQIEKENLINNFFEKLRLSEKSLLLLDYDGTLAPFTTDRSKAFMYPGIKDRLDKILTEVDTDLIIISGRALKDLTPLLNLEHSTEVWGSHGLECITKDGKYTPPVITPEVNYGLEEAKKICFQNGINPDFLEFKPASVALHWRGFDVSKRNELESILSPLWKNLTLTYPLELHSFNGGIELRPKGKSKADAIQAILNGIDNDTIMAYLGDDLTDEDAFKAISNKGLKILVNPEKRVTSADLQLFNFDEVLNFLDRWISVKTIKRW